jgi:hypothetical protein
LKSLADLTRLSSAAPRSASSSTHGRYAQNFCAARSASSMCSCVISTRRVWHQRWQASTLVSLVLCPSHARKGRRWPTRPLCRERRARSLLAPSSYQDSIAVFLPQRAIPQYRIFSLGSAPAQTLVSRCQPWHFPVIRTHVHGGIGCRVIALTAKHSRAFHW